MESLKDIIAGRIKSEGPITFESFMEIALYHPDFGYYTRRSTEFGRMGDFATSPQMHPIFGAMLGSQAEEMWELMSRPPRFDIIEPGGGRGYLALDMLEYLKDRPIYGSLRYGIVELNPSLRERQRLLLEAHSDKISWPESLASINGLKGLILSNELIDAMPVHLIEIRDGLKEVYVDLKDGDFVEHLGPPSTGALAEYLGEFAAPGLPEGYRTELNLRMGPWLREAAGALSKGFILTIDYGYPSGDLYGEGRERGTLMCYHRHRVNEEPLNNVGNQDITAHVNFSAMARWGEAQGLVPLGFLRQGPYLVSLGIDEHISRLMESGLDLSREMGKIKGLIMPGTMGDTHKVLVQSKGIKGTPKLRGFKMKNELPTLLTR